jgi:hypothetical protein
LDDYVGLILVLLLGFGFLFIRKSKLYKRNLTARLTGYALILMSVMLVFVVLIAHFSQASHGYGH